MTPATQKWIRIAGLDQLFVVDPRLAIKPATQKWFRIAGLVLHCLIAAMMLAAGSAKILGLMPADDVGKMGLTDWIFVIGIGEVTTAVLLVIPRTLPTGLWLASSFWGGAICLHMSKHENGPIVLTSVLLGLTWLGGVLRNPALLNPHVPTPQNNSEPPKPLAP